MCVCVRPTVSLSWPNGPTYRLEFWHGGTVCTAPQLFCDRSVPRFSPGTLFWQNVPIVCQLRKMADLNQKHCDQ